MSEVVLVTGGGGFIGTWVLREVLRRGARAVVVDVRPNAERWANVLGDRAGEVAWAEATLTDPESLRIAVERHSVTRVVHLAALLTPACQQDPWLGFRVNVMGGAAVFEAARRSERVRAISYASSYAVYGPEAGAESESESESESNRPTTFYGAYKSAVDLIAEQYWRHFGLASVAVRPHVVYGPERDQGLTAGPSLAAKAAATGADFHIGYTGTANYDYVEDVARAFVRAAFECPPGANAVDLKGEPATPEDFLHAIDAAVPGSAARITVGGPAMPVSVPPNPRYIAELFPDWHATSLHDGVAKTVDFYRKRGV